MIDSRTAPYAALLLRVSLGLLFLAHGWVKLFVFTPAGTAQFFASIGYPGLLGYIVILAEIGGGLALILGAWTRWVALGLLPIMLGATLFHLPNGFDFVSEGGGWEYPAFWAAALAVQALLGGGAVALRQDPLLSQTVEATV
jgi:putative oxidoreductase